MVGKGLDISNDQHNALLWENGTRTLNTYTKIAFDNASWVLEKQFVFNASQRPKGPLL